MQRILSTTFAFLCATLLSTPALAQNAPRPVEGTIKSVAPDKSHFIIPGKKADVAVIITPETRCVLDDAPSTATQAIAVGREITAILSPDGTSAFIVLATSVPIKGTVKSVAADGSTVVVTSKNGDDMIIKLTATTRFTLDKNASTLASALVAGSTVTITTDSDDNATEIAARPARAPKNPSPTPGSSIGSTEFRI